MAGRIVLFGATGYTGRLVADALRRRGARPLLAARNADALKRLADELGGELQTAVADVSRPETVRDLADQGDVLVSTVGPFVRFGAPAVEAAIGAGASYLDSTGEPPFIRRVFESWDEPARAAGAGLVTAFGYDFVPGNLAAALALERAGERAVKVSVGYFITGRVDVRRAMSGGTAASVAGIVLAPHFAYRDGRIVTERSAKRARSFETDGKRLSGVSVGCSEHFALPRLHASLREVDVYLGWFGPASRAMQAMSLLGELPGAQAASEKLSERFVGGSSGGPGPAERAKTGSLVVAEAYDTGDELLERVALRGPNGYTFTGEVLAWGARHAAEHGLEGAGALGPVEAFGLRSLETACAEIGLKEASPP